MRAILQEAGYKWCATRIFAGSTVYINNLDENVGGMISKLAEDTKIVIVVLIGSGEDYL